MSEPDVHNPVEISTKGKMTTLKPPQQVRDEYMYVRIKTLPFFHLAIYLSLLISLSLSLTPPPVTSFVLVLLSYPIYRGQRFTIFKDTSTEVRAMLKENGE
jgi:hypothetical protein